MAVRDGRSQDRIEALARRLHHPDASQLFFQVAEIGGDQAYLRHGIQVRAGDAVLDVGANVGVAAVFFAELCGAGLVHSFEPVGPICDLLRANVAGIDACVVHEQGVSNLSRRAEITYYPGACAMSGLHAEPERDRELVRTVLLNHGLSPRQAQESVERRYEAQTLTCELITLSEFLAQEGLDRVDLLKVDVERSEMEVLAGIDEADWPKIGQVAIEVHDEANRAVTIAGELRDRGFEVVCEQDPAMRGTSVRMLYARRP
jgi:31-O-methyltransferase